MWNHQFAWRKQGAKRALEFHAETGAVLIPRVDRGSGSVLDYPIDQAQLSLEAAPVITSGLLVTRELQRGDVTQSQRFAQDCSEDELRAICERLFVSQRHHGISVDGTAGWNVESNGTYGYEQDDGAKQ